MRIFKVFMIFSMLLMLCGLSAYAQNGEYPVAGEWFSFAVEQDGSPVKVVDNTAVLKKAPFTLVLILRGPIGVLVNFSESDILYKGFLKNKPLVEILKRPDFFMGIGESDGNPDELMLIDGISPHYLYYADGASHRFSSIERSGEYVIGRREISNYTTYTDEYRPSPVEELAADEIYISMMYSEWDADYNKIELQKEAVKVILKD